MQRLRHEGMHSLQRFAAYASCSPLPFPPRPPVSPFLVAFLPPFLPACLPFTHPPPFPSRLPPPLLPACKADCSYRTRRSGSAAGSSSEASATVSTPSVPSPAIADAEGLLGVSPLPSGSYLGGGACAVEGFRAHSRGMEPLSCARTAAKSPRGLPLSCPQPRTTTGGPAHNHRRQRRLPHRTMSGGAVCGDALHTGFSGAVCVVRGEFRIASCHRPTQFRITR